MYDNSRHAFRRLNAHCGPIMKADHSITGARAVSDVEDESSPMHPLEVIPWFRRWPRSFRRNVLYTVIMSIAIGAALLLTSLMYHNYQSATEFLSVAAENFVVSLVIGFTLHFFYSALNPALKRINRLPLWGVVLSYTVVGVAMMQVGLFFASLIPGFASIHVWMGSTQWIVTSLTISIVVSLMMSLAWQGRVKALMRESAQARERERLEAAERAAVEANLRALQAQIEPHFLFNTLANVVSLIEPAPQKARLMLQDFIEYLRASLASTRARHSSLGREAELMRAFLRLIQIRMGERLRFRVEVPESLQQITFPPMLLQPLIENAIKHGLEPTINGGEVVVRATAQAGFVEITVEDSGRGFQGDAQSGMGLANVRQRLTGLYGLTSSFVIEGRAPESGTRVTLRVPVPELMARELPQEATA
jgi:sensor histidine kinase YesM